MVNSRRQRGVALLIVLLILTMMILIASRMTLHDRSDIAQTQQVLGQSDNWQHLLSGEQLALAVLRHALRGDSRLNLSQRWHQPVTLPINSGLLHGQIEDASTCFNLNALRRGDNVSSQQVVQQLLTRLLQVESVPDSQARAIAAATRDWIDEGQQMSPWGAEDAAYQKQGYRPANSLLADVSQWREVRGVTPTIYQRVSPLLCALPSIHLRININFLQPKHAPLLEMFFDRKVQRSRILRILAHRPKMGYQHVMELFADPLWTGVKPVAGIKKMLTLNSRYFRAKLKVKSASDVRSELDSLVVRQRHNQLAVVHRELGDWH